jgi:short subunit dehydrogenase-like uncharacterized protein
MLLPGAGFDVVPSDCLAAHVASRLPGATRLRLSVGGLTQASRGTMKTMLEGIGDGLRVRRGGRIVSGAPPARASADFGEGSRPTVGVPWGDVSTAWRSTGIGDIEVFFEATRQMEVASHMPAAARRLLALRLVRRFMQRQVDRFLPPGPTAEHRVAGRAVILAQAWDASGLTVKSLLTTPEPYHLTARTAVEIARLAADGQALPGYQTPSLAFGAELIMRFDRVQRRDI